MPLKNASAGDLNMADIAVGVAFTLACASLYGLAVYLFRDQIWPEKYKAKFPAIPHLKAAKPPPSFGAYSRNEAF
jgi:hypothetical protein